MLSKELINGILTDEIEAIYIFDKLVGFNHDKDEDEVIITDGDFCKLITVDNYMKNIQFNILNESIKEYHRIVDEFVNYFIGYLHYTIKIETFEELKERDNLYTSLLKGMYSVPDEEELEIERNLR